MGMLSRTAAAVVSGLVVGKAIAVASEDRRTVVTFILLGEEIVTKAGIRIGGLFQLRVVAQDCSIFQGLSCLE